jgi:hypothetical protein
MGGVMWEVAEWESISGKVLIDLPGIIVPVKHPRTFLLKVESKSPGF